MPGQYQGKRLLQEKQWSLRERSMEMTDFIIEHVVPVIAILALAICMVGMAYRFGSHGYNLMTMRHETTRRTPTPYVPKKLSLLSALWAVNVKTLIIWLRANPVTAIGHVLYHLGFFTAMGTYGLVALISVKELASMPIYKGMLFVADWFNFKEEIFGPAGYLYLLGEFLYYGFLVALIIAVIGISIPFIMTLLHKRGMIRPIDSVVRAAGITHTDGLRTMSSSLGIQRKVIGLVVLIMDSTMLFTFLAPVGKEFGYIVHATFGSAIVAALPFSFLFHELSRWRAWDAAILYQHGMTA